MQMDALVAALRCLEVEGKAKCVTRERCRAHACKISRGLVRLGRLFTGAAGDDPGVKFFSAGS